MAKKSTETKRKPGRPPKPEGALKPFAFRLEPALVERVRVYAEELAKVTRTPVTLTTALKSLVARGLEHVEAEAAEKR